MCRPSGTYALAAFCRKWSVLIAERKVRQLALANRSHCGKLFLRDKLHTDLCEECFAALEAEFQALKRALRESPGMNAVQLSEKTGIAADRIMVLGPGRLHLSY